MWNFETKICHLAINVKNDIDCNDKNFSDGSDRATPEIASFTMLVINDNSHDTASALQTLLHQQKNDFANIVDTNNFKDTTNTDNTDNISNNGNTNNISNNDNTNNSSYDAKC